MPLDVSAGDLGARAGARGEDLAALLNVEDAGGGEAEGSTVGLGGGLSEDDGAKVSESNQGVTFLELFFHC